jgi:hypothetical protein
LQNSSPDYFACICDTLFRAAAAAEASRGAAGAASVTKDLSLPWTVPTTVGLQHGCAGDILQGQSRCIQHQQILDLSSGRAAAAALLAACCTEEWGHTLRHLLMLQSTGSQHDAVDASIRWFKVIRGAVV